MSLSRMRPTPNPSPNSNPRARFLLRSGANGEDGDNSPIDDVDVSELGFLRDRCLVVPFLHEPIEPFGTDSLALEAGKLDALTGNLSETLLVLPDRALQCVPPGPESLELKFGFQHLLFQRSEVAERVPARSTATAALACQERLNERSGSLFKPLTKVLDLIVDILQPLLVHRLAEDIGIALSDDDVALYLKPPELVLELADV